MNRPSLGTFLKPSEARSVTNFYAMHNFSAHQILYFWPLQGAVDELSNSKADIL